MKAAIYVRISTTRQHVDRQYAELELYAKSKDYVIVDGYEDQISGFRDEDERSELQRLKIDALTDKFDVILFSELSRLSRKTSSILELINYFRDECGKNLYFQKQNLYVTKDKSDLGSELQLNILATIGSYEIELAAERQMGGKIQKVKKRVWTHGCRPYGFNLNKDKTLCINEEEANLIREIYGLYLNGYTSTQVAHLLNDRGVTPPAIATDKPKQNKISAWHPHTVIEIIRARRNIGEFSAVFHVPDPKNKEEIRKRVNRKVAEKIEYTDESLMIIDKTTYDLAVANIKKRVQNKATAKKNISLLKQVLKCGHCGANFFYKRDGKKHELKYSCHNLRYSFKISTRKCKDGLGICAKRLDGLIVAMAKSKLLNQKHLFDDKETRINENNEKITNNENMIQAFRNVIKNVNIEFNNYIKLAYKHKVQNSLIDEESDKREKEIKKLEADIIILQNQNKSFVQQNKLLNKRKILTEDMMNLSALELKELFEEYIEEVLVYNSKTWVIINIKYKFGGDEFGLIRKNPKANRNMHYSKIVRELLPKDDYDFLSENNLLEIGNDIYYYGFYDNLEKQLIYNKDDEMFTLANKQYSINEFAELIYPKNMSNLHMYEYFSFDKLLHLTKSEKTGG